MLGSVPAPRRLMQKVAEEISQSQEVLRFSGIKAD
jgi:hypothetical protein